MRPVISENVRRTLLAYDWPGNVRELQNVLYRFVTLKRLDLTGETVSESPLTNASPEAKEKPAADLAAAVAAYEKRIIASALARNRWKRTRTAQTLGIGLRTLQRKMKAYGIQ
jgi:transcriptional regulator with PAS, ATPase and Fis domain